MAIITKFILVVLFVFPVCASCQEKVIKVDSEDIFLEYFYRNKPSTRIANDSVTYIARKISVDSFYLGRYVYKKLEWERVYVLFGKVDTMGVVEPRRDINGKLSNVHIRQPFYHARPADVDR